MSIDINRELKRLQDKYGNFNYQEGLLISKPHIYLPWLEKQLEQTENYKQQLQQQHLQQEEENARARAINLARLKQQAIEKNKELHNILSGADRNYLNTYNLHLPMQERIQLLKEAKKRQLDDAKTVNNTQLIEILEAQIEILEAQIKNLEHNHMFGLKKSVTKKLKNKRRNYNRKNKKSPTKKSK
jgi:hypothetical protein